MCKVVHCKREPYDVYIGRPSMWGNPYTIGKHGDRTTVIDKYRTYLWEQVRRGNIRREQLASLHGKTLGCWCKPQPCHGDVLAAAVKWAMEEEQ